MLYYHWSSSHKDIKETHTKIRGAGIQRLYYSLKDLYGNKADEQILQQTAQAIHCQITGAIIHLITTVTSRSQRDQILTLTLQTVDLLQRPLKDSKT